MKHVCYYKNHTTHAYKIDQKYLFSLSEFSASWRHKNSWIESYPLSPKHPPLQEIKFLLECRATICAGVNASMTRGSILDAESHHGIRVGTMKQNCVEDFIAQKKKC